MSSYITGFSSCRYGLTEANNNQRSARAGCQPDRPTSPNVVDIFGPPGKHRSQEAVDARILSSSFLKIDHLLYPLSCRPLPWHLDSIVSRDLRLAESLFKGHGATLRQRLQGINQRGRTRDHKHLSAFSGASNQTTECREQIGMQARLRLVEHQQREIRKRLVSSTRRPSRYFAPSALATRPWR